MALTPKQEKFAQCVASGMNQSDAYRAAYACEGMSDPAIYVEACRLAQDPNVSLRVSELQKPIAEKVGITLESYISEMHEMKKLALSDGEYGPAVKAFENVGKVLGYYVNKTELTGRNGAPIEHKITREIIDPVVDGTSEY